MSLWSAVFLILGAATLTLASPVPEKILDDKVEKYSVRSWFGGVSHNGHRKPGKYYPGYGGGYEGHRPHGGWGGGGAASSASASASAASAGGGGPGHGGSGSHSNSHANSHSATLGAGPFYGSLSGASAGASASSGAGSGTYHRKPKPYSHENEYYDY